MNNTPILAFYGSTVLIGSLLNPYLTQYQGAIISNEFEATLNRMLVSPFGYGLFTLVYLSHNFTHLSSRKLEKKHLFLYISYTISLCALVMWLFGPSIFDIVNGLTGGYCKEKDIPQFKCMQDGTNWVNGFDTSGHTFMLMGMSLLLLNIINDTKVGDAYAALEEGNLANSTVSSGSASSFEAYSSRLWNFCTQIRVQSDLLDYISYFLVVAWYAMLTITALFFHDLMEKVLGFILGVSVPLLLQYVIVRKLV